MDDLKLIRYCQIIIDNSRLMYEDEARNILLLFR
jgi:hypothetical protein